MTNASVIAPVAQVKWQKNSISTFENIEIYTDSQATPYKHSIIHSDIFRFCPVLRIYVYIRGHTERDNSHTQTQYTHTHTDSERMRALKPIRIHDEAHAHIHRSHGGSLYMFYGCFCGSLIAAVAAYITTASVLCEFRTHKPKMYH